jgi:hypothetical protein
MTCASCISAAVTNSCTPIQFSSISCGDKHVCGLGLHDSEAVCWGDDIGWGDWSGAEHFESDSLTQLVASFEKTCGILAPGNPVCFGGSDEPVPPALASEKLVEITAGTHHVCGLRAMDHTAVCWGYDRFGETDAPDVPFSMISAGWDHTCGISLNDSTVLCWGDDGYGEWPVVRPANCMFLTRFGIQHPITRPSVWR